MEKTDISDKFEKAVMDYFIQHVVFSTDGTAFKSFVMQLTPTTKLFVMK